MRFNTHSEIVGKHAFLSPSSYHWLNYDSQKLEARYYTYSAAQKGTDLHKLAHEAIRLGIHLDDTNIALAEYVADGIGYNMACEQPLFYSWNCFGCADTISFKDNLLRVHDLKNGVTATKFDQLRIYAALFCLEYSIDPFEIDIELRIYQRDEVRVDNPEPELILTIMDKIVNSDLQIETLREG